MQETLYLMVTLLDRYLSQVQIKKNEMQLVGLTALLLASKYEDFWHPSVSINIQNTLGVFCSPSSISFSMFSHFNQLFSNLLIYSFVLSL